MANANLIPRAASSLIVSSAGEGPRERLAQNTAAIPLVAPGYATVDAIAKFERGDQASIQLNVFNVADEEYADQLHGFRVAPGSGRSRG